MHARQSVSHVGSVKSKGVPELSRNTSIKTRRLRRLGPAVSPPRQRDGVGNEAVVKPIDNEAGEFDITYLQKKSIDSNSNKGTDKGPWLDELPDVLTVQQASSYLQVSRSIVYGEISAGRLPAVRLGMRVIRISKWALQRWLDRQSLELRDS